MAGKVMLRIEEVKADKRNGILDLDSMELQHIDLPVRQMAEFFSMTTRLAFVCLSNNKLAVYPPALCCACNITTLDLSHNRLTSLPDNFVAYKKLSTLKLTYNQFISRPTMLKQMPALKKILIQKGNPLKAKEEEEEDELGARMTELMSPHASVLATKDEEIARLRLENYELRQEVTQLKETVAMLMASVEELKKKTSMYETRFGSI